MSAHTPGPWVLERHARARIVGSESIHTNGLQRNSLGISSASYSETVCEFVCDIDLPGPRANAALIVAAPDLLRACESAKDHLVGDLVEPGRTVFWELVAAIAKARGHG